MKQTFNALTNVAQGGDEVGAIAKEEKSSAPLRPTNPDYL